MEGFIILSILILLLIGGWTPILYRRFLHDGKCRVRFRTILWALAMLIPMFMIAELTHGLPYPVIYPLAFVVVPALFNVCVLLRWRLRPTNGSANKSGEERREAAPPERESLAPPLPSTLGRNIMKMDSRETVLIGGREKREIKIADYDPSWPLKFDDHLGKIRAALGDRALLIEHVGSTSVPQLAAKPIIDIDVVVADSSDEAAYLPALEAAGYLLRVREPDWHEHRMLRTPTLDVHIHFFSPGSPEVTRHLLFRDHLRKHSEDRMRYESTKRTLANRTWNDMNEYAEAKGGVIEDILRSAGWTESLNSPTNR